MDEQKVWLPNEQQKLPLLELSMAAQSHPHSQDLQDCRFVEAQRIQGHGGSESGRQFHPAILMPLATLQAAPAEKPRRPAGGK